jgi:hypothetical protein
MPRKGGMGVRIGRTLTVTGASLSLFTSARTRRVPTTSFFPDIKASWLFGYGRDEREWWRWAHFEIVLTDYHLLSFFAGDVNIGGIGVPAEALLAWD